MKNSGLIIETDVICDFLTTTNSPSLLRRALAQFVCYTTFIQISELLQQASGDTQRNAVMSAIAVLRPLGAHPRYSENIARLLKTLADGQVEDGFRFAVTGAISQHAKLPVLTVRHQMVYSRLEIPAIKPDSVR